MWVRSSDSEEQDTELKLEMVQQKRRVWWWHDDHLTFVCGECLSFGKEFKDQGW
jgi:hypothetical protein